jgi:hypothetical protein
VSGGKRGLYITVELATDLSFHTALASLLLPQMQAFLDQNASFEQQQQQQQQSIRMSAGEQNIEAT